MDTTAGRGHTYGLRRACTESAVRGAAAGDRLIVGHGSRAGCTFDAKAHCTLAVEGGAPRDDYRVRSRTRLLRGKPTRAIEAWRRGRSSHRIQSAAALPRGVAVRELKRRQGAGVLLRWAHGGVAQLAGRDQRAAGRRSHVFILLQRTPGHCDRRPQAERRRSPRRERAALSKHHPHHRAVDQCGHGLSPVVEDL